MRAIQRLSVVRTIQRLRVVRAIQRLSVVRAIQRIWESTLLCTFHVYKISWV